MAEALLKQFYDAVDDFVGAVESKRPMAERDALVCEVRRRRAAYHEAHGRIPDGLCRHCGAERVPGSVRCHVCKREEKHG